MKEKIIISKQNKKILENFFEKECSCFCKNFNVYVGFEDEIEIYKRDLEDKLNELCFDNGYDVINFADSVNIKFNKHEYRNDKITISGYTKIISELETDEIILFDGE